MNTIEGAGTGGWEPYMGFRLPLAAALTPGDHAAILSYLAVMTEHLNGPGGRFRFAPDGTLEIQLPAGRTVEAAGAWVDDRAIYRRLADLFRSGDSSAPPEFDNFEPTTEARGPEVDRRRWGFRGWFAELLGCVDT